MPETTATSRRGSAIAAGLYLIALGALVRPEVVAATLTPDGQISGASKILAIRVAEAGAVGTGLLLLVLRRIPILPGLLADVTTVLLFGVVCLAVYGNLISFGIVP